MAGCGIDDGLGTVHGLWPQWKQYCTTEPFDAANLASIRNDLNIYWPTCTGSRTPSATEGFWNHEWTRHGVCSGMSQLEYFSTALSLAKNVRKTCTNFSHSTNPPECHTCFDVNLQTSEICSNNVLSAFLSDM